MKKIMFVCHGNICRSPMAEFIFADMIKRGGAEKDFYVSSSATSTEEIINGVGNPVYPPAREILERHKIDCSGKRAVQLKKSDYEKYDLFVGMDSMNIRNMYRILGKDSESKICKLMDFTVRGGDVADPWYSRNFEVAYRDIYDGCKGLIEHLTSRQYVASVRADSII